jgi:hypothetical protein
LPLLGFFLRRLSSFKTPTEESIPDFANFGTANIFFQGEYGTCLVAPGMVMKHFNRATKHSAFAARFGLCAGLIIGFSALADDTPAADQTPAPADAPAVAEPAPVVATDTPATNTNDVTTSTNTGARQWIYVNPGVKPATNGAPKWKQVKRTIQTRVLTVNRPENSFTIEYDGQLHRLKHNYGTYIFRKGRVVGLDWLVAGTPVTIDVIEWKPGRYDLVTATILQNKVEAQPAGVIASEKKLQRETSELAERQRDDDERAQKEQAKRDKKIAREQAKLAERQAEEEAEQRKAEAKRQKQLAKEQAKQAKRQSEEQQGSTADEEKRQKALRKEEEKQAKRLAEEQAEQAKIEAKRQKELQKQQAKEAERLAEERDEAAKVEAKRQKELQKQQSKDAKRLAEEQEEARKEEAKRQKQLQKEQEKEAKRIAKEQEKQAKEEKKKQKKNKKQEQPEPVGAPIGTLRDPEFFPVPAAEPVDNPENNSGKTPDPES